MTSTMERRRSYTGPALFRIGCRPLFLGAALWAVLAMAVWIGALTGALAPPLSFNALDWHVHELLFGYFSAVLAGFLLTATPNWTGRLPVAGAPLMFLTALWGAGRGAVFVGSDWPPAVVALIDLSFLFALIETTARELIRGRNWRNLKILLFIGIMFAGNVLFHVEAAQSGYAADGYGVRLGIGALTCLVLLVGGRIVPSFTRNWLKKTGRPVAIPEGFRTLDKLSMLAAGLSLLAWIVWPWNVASGGALAVAGLLCVARMARWSGWRTGADPLVLILHAGYLLTAVGMLVVAASILMPEAVPRAAGLHTLMIGGAATMTLAVMTRASLGHTGRALTATPMTVAIYVSIVLAALFRLLMALVPDWGLLLELSAIAWIVAFAGFALHYGPMLVRPRADGKG